MAGVEKVWLLGALAAMACGGASIRGGGPGVDEETKGEAGVPAKPNGSGGAGNPLPNDDVGHAGEGSVYEPSAGGPGHLPAGGTASYAGGPSHGGRGSEQNPDCSSEPVGSLSDWQPREPDQDASVAQRLADVRSTLAGSWHGVATTPWVPPYAVVMTFTAEGDYSARCTNNSDYAGADGCCRALYYGSDRDSTLKHWRLSSITEDGTFSGELDVAFCYDDQACSAPAWQGELKKLEYDASGDRLRFEFWNDRYGPVALDLQRD
jgi:hypothetical protein